MSIARILWLRGTHLNQCSLVNILGTIVVLYNGTSVVMMSLSKLELKNTFVWWFHTHGCSLTAASTAATQPLPSTPNIDDMI
jgi:hypothetical protein